MGADSGGVIYNKEKRTLYSMLRKIPFKHLKKQSLWCHISMKCRVGAVESCSSSTSIPLLYGSFEKEGVPCTKNSLPFKNECCISSVKDSWDFFWTFMNMPAVN